jgi:signal transduction histidine kinase
MLAGQNDELEATVTELRQTRAQLVEAERQAERARISRDLHDSVGAQLSSLLAGVELARLGQGTHGGPPTTLDEVEADAREAMQQLRETVWALRAESLTAGALAAQIRRFAEPRVRRAGMTLAVTVKEHAATVLSPPQALNLYRIAQEAVQNAVKHSGGRTVRVTLSRDDETLRLCVADDGRPSAPESRDGGAPGGFGLSSMRDRAEALGGALVMDSSAGTSVEVAVPLAQATDA